MELNIYTGYYCIRSVIKASNTWTVSLNHTENKQHGPETHQNSLDSCCWPWDIEGVCVLDSFWQNKADFSVHSQVQVKTLPQASPATRLAWLLTETSWALVPPYSCNDGKSSSQTKARIFRFARTKQTCPPSLWAAFTLPGNGQSRDAGVVLVAPLRLVLPAVQLFT